MGKFDDILHAFIDGEASPAQEDTLIRALLDHPKLREQFVRSCRIHHATLSAFSADQAAEFKHRLDVFCVRWESASSHHRSEVKTAFGAGMITSGIAAAAVFTIGFGSYSLLVRSESSPNSSPSLAEAATAPVTHVRLVQPSKDLSGEPLYVTFGIADFTADDDAPDPHDSMPVLSDTFSQAYIELLKEEQNILSARGAPVLGEPRVFGFESASQVRESWIEPRFQGNQHSYFSYEMVSE